jgi:hypothetical protein
LGSFGRLGFLFFETGAGLVMETEELSSLLGPTAFWLTGVAGAAGIIFPQTVSEPEPAVDARVTESSEVAEATVEGTDAATTVSCSTEGVRETWFRMAAGTAALIVSSLRTAAGTTLSWLAADREKR